MFLQDFTGHPNIITLQNVIKADNDKDIYLVFDFMGENLINLRLCRVLKKKGKYKNITLSTPCNFDTCVNYKLFITLAIELKKNMCQ